MENAYDIYMAGALPGRGPWRARTLDRVPIAPELFYYLPVRVTGLRCIDVAPVGLTLPFHQLKTWQAQLASACHFDCCGWVMPAANAIHDKVTTETEITTRPDGSRNVEARPITPQREPCKRPTGSPWTMRPGIQSAGQGSRTRLAGLPGPVLR